MIIENNIKTISGMNMLYEVPESTDVAIDWAKNNRLEIESFLASNGALLIRGLNEITDADFARILTAIYGEDLLKYTYRSTPRNEVKKNIYTATEYHPSQWIPQHNENSYSNTWPMRIAFLCKIVAEKNGNTPISDARSIYKKIPVEIREEFERKKIMYVRNYSDLDLPWTEVFQTNDKNEVEQYCQENDILFEWKPDGLRTKQINQATIEHPIHREKLWFNQAHLFHLSNLEEDLQEGFIEMLGEENVPRNTYFGDGSPIDTEMLRVIREVYKNNQITFQWEENDLLLLDNMLFTHGREPYEGDRKVLVGMQRKYSVEQIKSF